MRTNKLLCALLFAASLFSKSINAADLVVEEFGTTPAYPSISAAISASVDGDRILIRNRAGNIPWIENITINKSLELLSYENDTFFVVQGTYTINSGVGRKISIIGMKNLSGSINAGTSSGSNKTTTVNILDCYLSNGGIYLNTVDFNTTIAGCTMLGGRVYISSGSIIGNNLNNGGSSASEVLTVANSSSFQNDTVYIIGNTIKGNVNGVSSVYWNSSASIAYIKNNFIIHQYAGIYMLTFPNTTIANLIYNNTIYGELYNFSNYGLFISSVPSNAIVEIMNNVIDAFNSGTKYGIYVVNLNGQANAYYNHIDNGFNTAISGNLTFSGNNTTNSTVGINLLTGVLNPGNLAIDGGNPANPFYDLDLTVGDAGAYGGSYSLANYFPLHSGGARIYSVAFPFNIRSGNTLNVKASGYDR
ncbi:MAG TPA: hypothetical protein PLI68_01975 [Bacteroidia bacterium]|nr:hypothetical protein [Bacteroidia bacterium]HRH08297.1 hypothetical protein [Bacteroidia bacterium]HRH62072.1 hypothetical protein [Bacteroidia bacterium]